MPSIRQLHWTNAMRPALFLDRDGVINVERDYVHRIADFEWQPGIFDLARWAVKEGLALVVVTNQSGIGRGLYTEQDFQSLTTYMRERFMSEGAPVDAVYHCPFHPDAILPEYRSADHPWRKPRPGMILAATRDLDLDLAQSILIGDRAGDIAAAYAAGVGHAVLIGPHEATPVAADPDHAAVTRCATLTEALAHVQQFRSYHSK